MAAEEKDLSERHRQTDEKNLSERLAQAQALFEKRFDPNSSRELVCIEQSCNLGFGMSQHANDRTQSDCKRGAETHLSSTVEGDFQILYDPQERRKWYEQWIKTEIKGDSEKLYDPKERRKWCKQWHKTEDDKWYKEAKERLKKRVRHYQWMSDQAPQDSSFDITSPEWVFNKEGFYPDTGEPISFCRILNARQVFGTDMRISHVSIVREPSPTILELAKPTEIKEKTEIKETKEKKEAQETKATLELLSEEYCEREDPFRFKSSIYKETFYFAMCKFIRRELRLLEFPALQYYPNLNMNRLLDLIELELMQDAFYYVYGKGAYIRTTTHKSGSATNPDITENFNITEPDSPFNLSDEDIINRAADFFQGIINRSAEFAKKALMDKPNSRHTKTLPRSYKHYNGESEGTKEQAILIFSGQAVSQEGCQFLKVDKVVAQTETETFETMKTSEKSTEKLPAVPVPKYTSEAVRSNNGLGLGY